MKLSGFPHPIFLRVQPGPLTHTDSCHPAHQPIVEPVSLTHPLNPLLWLSHHLPPSIPRHSPPPSHHNTHYTSQCHFWILPTSAYLNSMSPFTHQVRWLKGWSGSSCTGSNQNRKGGRVHCIISYKSQKRRLTLSYKRIRSKTQTNPSCISKGFMNTNCLFSIADLDLDKKGRIRIPAYTYTNLNDKMC